MSTGRGNMDSFHLESGKHVQHSHDRHTMKVWENDRGVELSYDDIKELYNNLPV